VVLGGSLLLGAATMRPIENRGLTMNHLFAWLGRVAAMAAVLMCVPPAYVIVPQLMAMVGMMSYDSAMKPWEQAQPFIMAYVGIWIAMGILYAVGRGAEERISRKVRQRGSI
jgi:membrane protein DedA with SNARE-associated domain